MRENQQTGIPQQPNLPLNMRRESRNYLRDAVMLIPNFIKMLLRLLRDSRVPKAEKALLVGAIAYVISPLDLMPDVLPFVGQVDDIYLVALTMIRLLGHTPSLALRDHWEGPGDIVNVVDKIIMAAQYVLPARIKQILLGRVEMSNEKRHGFLPVVKSTEPPLPPRA